MNVLIEKLKDVLYSVVPVTLVVIILHYTIVPLEGNLFPKFLLGAFLLIIGLAIFLLGVDLGVTPIGSLMGNFLAKSNKVWILVIAGLLLGFFISIAEPDLHIIAEEVDQVTSGFLAKMDLIYVVSLGVATILTVGLLRIVYNKPLNRTYSIIYLLIFAFAIFSSPEFLAIAFDSSGATTGAMTVPFILALGLGVASLKKNGKASEEDSFGLVGMASAGAILAVLMMSVLTRAEITGNLDATITHHLSIWSLLIQETKSVARDVFVAISPLAILFIVFQFLVFKLPRKQFNKIIKGLIYTFFGLLVFLTGVNVGFMEAGRVVGQEIAAYSSTALIVGIGFFIGLLTILAEPAVHVLTHQIENVTTGHVPRKLVLGALSIGVGLAVALSMLRIILPGLELWHILLPGYTIALAMTYYVPPLFVGIAFDSGGVASGPMTATFILAFAQGVSSMFEGANVLIDGFGVIALVALTPLIALQVLGLVFKRKVIAEEAVVKDKNSIPETD